MIAALALLVGCPPDMAQIENRFCIDRYEAPNLKGEKPFTGMLATEGEAWCEKRGKRLCTEDEWLRACQGASGREFPYGATYARGRCDDDKVWRAPDWGKIQTFPAKSGRDEIARLDQADPSGSRTGCVSEDDVFDLVGNVSEWVVKTRFHTTPYRHVLMGCYWSGCYGKDRDRIQPNCLATNAGHPGDSRAFRTYEAGFRCCLSLSN
jgi:formylglycine-generating enzyme required for sulfatase activity